MRVLTFGSVLILFCVSLFSVSWIVLAHENGSTHQHPHPPEQYCMTCGVKDIPWQHYCLVAERQKQEQEVKNSNSEANNKRLEEKVDDNADKNIGDVLYDIGKGFLSDVGTVVVKVGEWVTGEEGSVKCPGGCGNLVSDDEEHWGTGNCAIGHLHWTCNESERTLHAGCYYVDEPETNPDAIYDGAKYSVTCGSCGEVRWTNDLGTYMDWQNNSYCSDCRYMYGY